MAPASKWRSALSMTSSKTFRWRVRRTPRFSRAACRRPGRLCALIRSPAETRCAAVGGIVVGADARQLAEILESISQRAVSGPRAPIVPMVPALAVRQPQNVIVHNDCKHQQEEDHADRDEPLFHADTHGQHGLPLAGVCNRYVQ